MRDARFLLLVLPLVLCACGRGDFSARTTAASDTLRVPLTLNPTTLDPAVVRDTETGNLLSQVFEPLFAYNEKNELSPALAERLEVEEGGRAYVFTLRQAKFHNGRTVTAQDVKASLERSCDPALGASTAATYLTDIVGVGDRLAGKAEDIRGVTVVDDRTVRIEIDAPRAYFLGKLTYPCAMVIDAEAAGEQEIASPAQAVGTGPFRLARLSEGQAVELEAFSGYHGGAPRVARISMPILKDASTRLNKYRAGELDILTLPLQDVPAAEADAALKPQLRFEPRPSVFYLGINPRAYAPFRDLRVRRALALAIDRAKICREILRGSPEATGLVPPGIPGDSQRQKGLSFDPVAARKLLEEAGFPGGKGMPPLAITHRDSSSEAGRVSEAIATGLRQTLGIPVKVRTLEMRTFLESAREGELPLYYLSWSADYLDAQNFLSLLFRTGAANNRDRYTNPDFDALVDEADRSSDAARRAELYARAEGLLLEDVARIPLSYGRDPVLVSPRVTGLRGNLFGFLPFSSVELKKR